jgi:hypothetical protein
MSAIGSVIFLSSLLEPVAQPFRAALGRAEALRYGFE